MTHSIISRAVAGVAGALAAGAALAIMLADVETLNPKTWHLEHGLMPVVLTLTIVAGHYAVATVRQRRVASCLGWCVVALVGTGVTLYTSLGRQNDTNGRSSEPKIAIGNDRRWRNNSAPQRNCSRRRWSINPSSAPRAPTPTVAGVRNSTYERSPQRLPGIGNSCGPWDPNKPPHRRQRSWQQPLLCSTRSMSNCCDVA